MTELILCSSELAKTPYYILGLGMSIYSCEELCFYLCENSHVLDRDIMDVKLCQWIERELGLRKLGKQLYELLDREATLSEFVTTILRETHYSSAREIEEIEEILEESANLGFTQKRKTRADNLLRSNKLSLAIDEYHYILQGMQPDEDPHLYSSILHNVATAYARLFLFDKARDYYKMAFDADQNEESYLQYLAAIRIAKDEKQFQNTIVLKGIDMEAAAELERRINEIASDKPDSDYAKSVENIQKLRDEGKVNAFYQEIDRILNSWKTDYRKNIMNV